MVVAPAHLYRKREPRCLYALLRRAQAAVRRSRQAVPPSDPLDNPPCRAKEQARCSSPSQPPINRRSGYPLDLRPPGVVLGGSFWRRKRPAGCRACRGACTRKGQPRREGAIRIRGKSVLIALASAVATLAVIGVAFAGSEESTPKGPYIEFCPTMDQIEAYLAERGFDYKPTVACGENGQELAPAVNNESDPPSEKELFAAEKQSLLTATRAPDTDGDPLTMEIILADGTKSVIFIQGDPEFYKDMTPAEFAELVYP
jgi:hypothetical protein